MAAAATDKFQKVAIATATTLDAPGYTIGGTSITVASTSTWPTDTGITFAIDEIDANGDRVANSYNEYVGIVASGTSVTNVSHVNGTDRDYSAGATTRVYIPVSEERENRLVEGILADHSQAGAHEIATNFDPANPTLETQKWVGVSSAVNELTVTNSATGNPVRQAATGGDTNIDHYFKGKGTGSARFAGPYDGWAAADETLTYASATTFTCSAALAGTLQAGDRIKLTQTTAKYFYVTGVSGTTVTITGGSDYTLANAAITSPYYSHEENPTGFPVAFSWTPTWTNLTVGNGTLNYAKFVLVGRNVHFRVKFTLGNTSAVGTTPGFSTPVTAASNYVAVDTLNSFVQLNDADSGRYVGVVQIGTTSRLDLSYISSTPTMSTVTANDPFVWTTNDQLIVAGSYEV